MVKLKRFIANPILLPTKNQWEKDAVFNGCPIKDEGNYHLLYRAMGEKTTIHTNRLRMSTIGKATSTDGVVFNKRELFIR